MRHDDSKRCCSILSSQHIQHRHLRHVAEDDRNHFPDVGGQGLREHRRRHFDGRDLLLQDGLIVRGEVELYARAGERRAGDDARQLREQHAGDQIIALDEDHAAFIAGHEIGDERTRRADARRIRQLDRALKLRRGAPIDIHQRALNAGLAR